MIKPHIISLEGECNQTAELLGIEEIDIPVLSRLSNRDISYLNMKYPEYMGIWPILAKIGSAVGSGVVSIAKAVKERRQEKKEESAIEQQRQAIEQQRLYLLQEQQKKEKLLTLLVVIGVPAAAILLLNRVNRGKK